MNKIAVFTTLTAAAIIALSAVTAPAAVSAAPLDVNVQVSGYLPAPPGVHVYVDAGRPYYMERDRRVYVERDRRNHKHKHRHGHGDRECEDHGPGKH